MKSKFLFASALALSLAAFAAVHTFEMKELSSAAKAKQTHKVERAQGADVSSDVAIRNDEHPVLIRLERSAVKTVAAFLEAIEPSAHATAPSTLNASSYLDYSSSNYNQMGVNTDWVALPGQPSRTFHRICVQDTSGKTIALGNGASPDITTQLLIAPQTGSSAQVTCYPFGLSYGGSSQSIWIKVYSGGRAISGQNVVNFLY